MTKRNRLLTALLTLVALCAILFSFASCGKDKYPEIKSSKKEATVVATLGGHDVKYELFRAYFSQMYSGKTSGMTEEEWNEAKTAVLREIAELYATFDVASESGVDPYGSAINDEVKELVRIMYEGGEVNGEYVGGFESREEYKAALAAANLSDAANRLIFRYSATQAALFDYLVKNYSNGAKDPTSLGDPETFFNSDACTRGVWVAVFDDVIYYKDQTLQGRAGARAKAAELRDDLAGATDYAAVRKALIAAHSDYILTDDEMNNGLYVTKNQGNSPLMRALVADLFTLAPYACGPLREGPDGVYFAVGLPKDAADYNREVFFELLIEEEWINRPIVEKAEAYLAGVSYTSAFPTFSAETIAELTVE